MLKRALTTRFVIGSLLFIVCTIAMFVSCTKDPGTTASPPVESVQFVADAEKRLLELNLKYSRADWIKSTYITEDTELLSAEANKAVIEATTELAKEARRFEGQNLTPDVQRKLKLLKLALVLPAPDNPAERDEITKLAASLEGDYGKGKYCPEGIRENASVSATWERFSLTVVIPKSSNGSGSAGIRCRRHIGRITSASWS